MNGFNARYLLTYLNSLSSPRHHLLLSSTTMIKLDRMEDPTQVIWFPRFFSDTFLI